MFFARLSVRIKIQGCPEYGLEALDYRRALRLPERLDNRADVKIDGPISEKDFRKLASAGWLANYFDDGSACLTFNRLGERYDPTARYGHCATIPVSAEDSPVDLACHALLSCRREEAGIPDLEQQASKLEQQASDIRARIKTLSGEVES